MENDLKRNNARKGYESIEIIVHRASSIPNNYIMLTRTLVKCQSKHSLKIKQADNDLNTTSPVEGINPIWNQIIQIETLEENIYKEELLLLLIDQVHKTVLAEFKIPWTYLYPFYQYNLELISVNNKRPLKGHEIKLYVSLYRRMNNIEANDPGVFGLEVLLNSINESLPVAKSVYAVARIVPQYENYEAHLANNENKYFEFKSVIFPSPSMLSYQPADFNLKGFPQITLPTSKSKLMIWSHNFWFSTDEEKEAIFRQNNKTALFIEFYHKENLSEIKSNQLKLFGWCKLKFDEKRKKVLLNDDVSLGFKSDLKFFDISDSIFEFNSTSGNRIAEVAIRFAKHNQQLIKVMNMADIDNAFKLQPKISKQIEEKVVATNPIAEPKSPRFEPFIPEEILNEEIIVKQKIPDPIQQHQAVNAVQEIEQDQINLEQKSKSNDFYEAYLNKPKTRTKMDRNKEADLKTKLLTYRDDYSDIPLEYRYAFVNFKHPNSNDIDGVLYYYHSLLSSYRGLVRKMSDDNNLLKNQLRTVEQVNFQLTNKMTNFAEKKLALLKMSEINEMDRISLNKSFLELRTKLSMKTDENLALKNKIERLEKQLERRKTVEDEMEKVAHVHNEQNKDIEQMQLRLAQAFSLEDTVKRQELVIEKLENLIHRLVGGG